MESSSKGFYESMRDDIVKEVKKRVEKEIYYEAKAEGRILGREEDREEGRIEGRIEGREEVLTLVADLYSSVIAGKSDEEVLKAYPDLTLEKVKAFRQAFEENHE